MIRKVAVVLVIGLVVAFFWSCGAQCPLHFADTSPTGVVEAAIYAIEDRNPDEVAKYYFGPVANTMKWRMEALYTQFSAVQVENVATALIYEEQLNARVEAHWDLIVSAPNGDSQTEHCEQKVRLCKVDDKWLIKEAL